MQPPKAVNGNIFELSEREMKRAKIESIPEDLQQAIREMEADPFIRETLGDHVFNKYVEAKKSEWDTYRKQVSQWEIDEYLYKI
jgi:glutamine synthetase